MSYSPDSFMGGVFSWFTGVVEDVNDPLQMGRIRVRCIGYHTDDRGLIKTTDLPWASVMTPVNSASMSGIGMSATGVLPGSWVIGFFRDGPSAQDPIVLGTIPSMTEQQPDKTKGFSDPDGKYPLPAKLGTPDTPLEASATYKLSDAYVNREKYLEKGIHVAEEPQMHGAPFSELPEYVWFNWNIADVVKPKYPKNHVFRSESGHVREIDDTPGYERTLDFHKAGTYVEVDSTGNKTTTVVGDNQTVVVKDDSVHIIGNVRLTVDGDLRHYVGGNYILEVGKNKTEYVHGHSITQVLGNSTLEAEKVQIVAEAVIVGHPNGMDSAGKLAKGDTTGTIPNFPGNGFTSVFGGATFTGGITVNSGFSGWVPIGGGGLQISNGVVTNYSS